jgi:phage terminase small subunit
MALTHKQIRFCEEYLVDFNRTQAAIRAGYSRKTAKVIGSENLTKPDIKAEIEKKLESVSLSAAETRKLLSDMARSSLNDYFTIRKVERTPRIEITLLKHIQQLEEEFRFEEEFASLAGYDEDELKAHTRNQNSRKRTILRYNLELKKNPKATIIVHGPTEWVEVAELDMVKLVADKEKGKIKSISPGQFGAKVELFSADSALVNVARTHGLFEKDNAQLKPESVPMTEQQVDKVIEALKKIK